MASNNFFPSIRSIAEQTDALPDAEETAADAPPVVPAEEPAGVEEIESLCMSCGEQGMTRMMLTSIPYFREVILMSFRCEHCGTSNNEVQDAGIIRDHGLWYSVKVLNVADLNRQLIKSRFGTVVIPELEITIPPSRGQLTTIEGLLRGMVLDLSQDQALRRIQDPASYEKIESILSKLKGVVPDQDDDDGKAIEEFKLRQEDDQRPVPPFTVKIDDPSGNSFIEFIGSMADPKWTMKEYTRELEHNVQLGLVNPDELEANKQKETFISYPKKLSELVEAPEADEVLVFQGHCSSCARPCDTRMKRVDIPYFKEIIIMSTNCEACGYKDNEVKTSGAISEKGKRITLKVEEVDDLNRDILKSETCGLQIPEIELVLQGGTLGGRFTTVEGILDQIFDELSGKLFGSGDAIDDNNSINKFLSNLKEVKAVTKPFTLILDDPVANSYLQNLYAPDPDPNMTIEWYERTKEQDDDLGINDMKLENYEHDAEINLEDDGELGDGHTLDAVKEEEEPVSDAKQ